MLHDTPFRKTRVAYHTFKFLFNGQNYLSMLGFYDRTTIAVWIKTVIIPDKQRLIHTG